MGPNPQSRALLFGAHLRQTASIKLLVVWALFVEASWAGFACVSNPCQHGVCIDHVNSSYSCYCEDGFTGYECQTNWNECWSQPCRNGASCVDSIANYNCLCPPGYTGRWCERQINECLSNPCLNNGTCRDLVDRYVCVCPVGYRGANCEVDVSICNVTDGTEPKCKHEGVCVDGPGLAFTCLCTSGWEGRMCEEDVDECITEPCFNGGVCVNALGSFSCACPHGFAGEMCQRKVVQCMDGENFCQNNALCVKEEEQPICYCVPDFHGIHCQHRYNDCLPYSPRCMNGGTCIDGVDSFQCSCPNDSSGLLCECVETDNGEICEIVPKWFEEKEFYPIILADIAPSLPSASMQLFTDPSVMFESSALDYEGETLFPSQIHTSMLSSLITLTTLPDSVLLTSPDDISITPTFSSQAVIEASMSLDIVDVQPSLILEETILTSSPITQTPHTLFTSFHFARSSDIYETPYFTTQLYLESLASHMPYTTATYPASEVDAPPERETTPIVDQELPSENTTSREVTSTSTTLEVSTISEEADISEQVDSVFKEVTKTITEEKDFTEEYVASTTGEYSSPGLDYTTLGISDTLLENVTATIPSTVNFSDVIHSVKSSTYASSTDSDITFDTKKETTDETFYTFESSRLPLTSSTDDSMYENVTSFDTRESEEITWKSLLTMPYDKTSLITQEPTYFENTSLSTTTEDKVITDLDFASNMTLTTLQPPDLTMDTVGSTVYFDPSTQESLLVTKDRITTITTELTTQKNISESSVDSFEDLSTKPFITETTNVSVQSEYRNETQNQHEKDTLASNLSTMPTELFPYTSEVTQSYFISEGSLENFTTISLTYPIYPDSTTPWLPEATEGALILTTSDRVGTEASAPSETPEETPFTESFPRHFFPTQEFQANASSEGTPTTSEDTSCLALTCYNGGSCVILSSGNPACHCPFNYFGLFCETYKYVTHPYFKGSSYIKIRTTELLLRTGVKMYIQFVSESPNGLLSYSEGNADTFFMLLLRNSLLQFVFSCGLQTVSFLQGNRKLSVNSQTNVSIRLWWSPYSDAGAWGRGKCKASLQVNDSSPVYSEQEAASSRVRLGDVFLGGLPASYTSPLVIKAGFLPRFRGCISLLEINELEVDPWLAAAGGEEVGECGATLCPLDACFNGGSCVPGVAEWTCICPERFEGALCEKRVCDPNPCFAGTCIPSFNSLGAEPFCLCPAESKGPLCKQPLTNETGSHLEYTGSFKGYSSFSSHRINFDHRKSIVIRLHFTTRLPYQLGLLFYLGRQVNSSSRDFFALAIVRGYLMLTWDLGAGPRRVLSPEPLDSSWHTHSVRVGRNRRQAWIEVDTHEKVSGAAPGFLSSLGTNGILFLGGHPSWNLSHLPVDLSRLNGFQGCIFDVRVAKAVEGPWVTPTPLRSLGIKECGKDICDGHLCSNGAVCQPVGATYQCLCTPGWKGPFCKVASHTCAKSKESCSPGSSCITEGAGAPPPKCLCSFGRVGPRCEQGSSQPPRSTNPFPEVNITDPLLSGDRSFLSLRVGNILRRYSSISFEFRPLQEFGILFLAVSNTPSGDYMSLIIDSGRLYFSYKLGSGNSNAIEIKSNKRVTTEKWQLVSLKRDGREGALTFDGETIVSSPLYLANNATEGRLTSMAELLDVQNEIFIGGYPEKTIMDEDIIHLRKIPNYKGCIRKVMIGETHYRLDERENRLGLLRGQGVSDCDGTACGAGVCANKGTCLPDFPVNSFKCQCLEGFEGRRCEIARQCLNHKCRHGGTCDPVVSSKRKGQNTVKDSLALELENKATDSYTCLCPPMKSGIYCDKVSKSSSAQFRGKSYAVVQQGSFLPFSNPLKDGFSFNFTTSEEEGLILWKGSEDIAGDYLGLGVRKGKLKLTWHLGGEIIGQVFSQDFVNDSKWHSVSVFREARVATLYTDGVPYRSGVEGDFDQLNSPNKFYIGGFPEGVSLRYRTDHQFVKAFVGCVKDLNIQPTSTPILFSDLKEGRDLQPCPSAVDNYT